MSLTMQTKLFFHQYFSTKIAEMLYERIKDYPAYYFVTTADQILFEQEIRL